jgi:putative SOS response-associated peptidase YedK
MLAAMCGRYTNTAGPEEIAGRLDVKVTGERGTGRYNIAPTQEVLAIVAPAGEPEARLLRWGLLPPWAKEASAGYKMINARLESVLEKRTYRSLVATAEHRALQVADGWYEWLKAEKPGQPRQPIHFKVDGGVPFAFAALWMEARIEGEQIGSVVLLTCDSAPNKVASAVHDRMPVVLADPEARRAWLDPALSAQDVLALCGPLAAERVSAAPANPALNKVGGVVEGPDLLVAPAGALPSGTRG